MPQARHATDGEDLSLFACPNPDCDAFNRFGGGNLSVVERMGRGKAIRRLYCDHCQHRFSERRGSLLAHAKLPPRAVARIVKCLGHGCSVEAAADICDVDPRTVERVLERAGRRADDFHRLQSQRLERPPEAVELDELHGRVCKAAGKKGAPSRPHGPSPRPGPPSGRGLAAVAAAAAAWAGIGSTRPWRCPRGS
jgi:transposase-like protein